MQFDLNILVRGPLTRPSWNVKLTVKCCNLRFTFTHR